MADFSCNQNCCVKSISYLVTIDLWFHLNDIIRVEFEMSIYQTWLSDLLTWGQGQKKQKRNPPHFSIGWFNRLTHKTCFNTNGVSLWKKIKKSCLEWPSQTWSTLFYYKVSKLPSNQGVCSNNVASNVKGPFTHNSENAVIEASSTLHRNVIEFFVVMHENFDETSMKAILNYFFFIFEKNGERYLSSKNDRWNVNAATFSMLCVNAP